MALLSYPVILQPVARPLLWLVRPSLLGSPLARAVVARPQRARALVALLPARAAASRLAAAAGSSGGGGLSLQPSTSALPGGSTLHQLTNGLGAWALIASLVGLIVGAATWALGAHSNNYQHTVTGKRAVLVSAVAALLIGAAPTLLNFMFAAGQSAK
jgi:hypothetical protein